MGHMAKRVAMPQCSAIAGTNTRTHTLHTHTHCTPTRLGPRWATPLQIVTTTIEPKLHSRGSLYDAYEYTAHSHTYMSDSTPAAKFTYDMSPIQVGKGLNLVG